MGTHEHTDKKEKKNGVNSSAPNKSEELEKKQPDDRICGQLLVNVNIRIFLSYFCLKSFPPYFAFQARICRNIVILVNIRPTSLHPWTRKTKCLIGSIFCTRCCLICVMARACVCHCLFAKAFLFQERRRKNLRMNWLAA